MHAWKGSVGPSDILLSSTMLDGWGISITCPVPPICKDWLEHLSSSFETNTLCARKFVSSSESSAAAKHSTPVSRGTGEADERDIQPGHDNEMKNGFREMRDTDSFYLEPTPM